MDIAVYAQTTTIIINRVNRDPNILRVYTAGQSPALVSRATLSQHNYTIYMKLSKTILSAIALSAASMAYSQDVAIKSNLLDDAVLNVNVGVELGAAPKWTFDIPVSLNNWSMSHDRTWKHWSVQPGVRYWLCEKFGGHFFGAHIHGGQYNIGGFDGKLNFLGTDFSKLADTRFQGWFIGAGVSYGYAWMLDKHWNIEGEIGLGYSYTRYDQFQCAGCGKKIKTNKPHNYVGLTKAALNIVYLF